MPVLCEIIADGKTENIPLELTVERELRLYVNGIPVLLSKAVATREAVMEAERAGIELIFSVRSGSSARISAKN